MSEETSVLAQAGHRIEEQDRIILDQAAEIARLKDLIADVLKTARGDESYAVKRVCYDIAETTLEVGQ